MNVTASNGVTRLTLSFLLSLLSDNIPGPEAPVTSKHHWAYKGPEGPETWHVHYKLCAGERQSPIDILPLSCEYDPTLEPVILDHFEYTSARTGPCVLNVTNNGHSASVRISSGDMTIRGGGLQGSYKTSEFHFHWGSTDDLGSEHAVDGHKYPLEMHVVNYAEKYGTIRQAMTKSDGLAVLGVLFQVSEQDNPNFAALDEALKHVHKAGEHNLVEQLVLRSLLPDDLSKYWRYNGSLTTPYCFESVIWTVFAEPQKISHAQLETLRSLLHEEGHDISDRGDHHTNTPSRLLDNWRPVQPLNARKVTRSFADATYGGVYARFPPVASQSETSKVPPATMLPATALSGAPSQQTGAQNQTWKAIDPVPQLMPYPTPDNGAGTDINQIYSMNRNPGTTQQSGILSNHHVHPSDQKPPTGDDSSKALSLVPLMPTEKSPGAPHDSEGRQTTTQRSVHTNENSVHTFQPHGQSTNIQNILFDTKQDPNLPYLISRASPVRTVVNDQQSLDASKSLPLSNGESKVSLDSVAAAFASNTSDTSNSSGVLLNNTGSFNPDSDSSPSSASYSHPGQTSTSKVSTTLLPATSVKLTERYNEETRQRQSENYWSQPRADLNGENLPLSYLMQHPNGDKHQMAGNGRVVPMSDSGHLSGFPSVYPNTATMRDVFPESHQHNQHLYPDNVRIIMEKLAATNRINTRYPNGPQSRPHSNSVQPAPQMRPYSSFNSIQPAPHIRTYPNSNSVQPATHLTSVPNFFHPAPQPRAYPNANYVQPATQLISSPNGNQIGGPEFSNTFRDRDGNLLMVSRANGDIYMVRPSSNSPNKLSPVNFHPQEQHFSNHHQQVDFYQQSVNVISGSNAKYDSPGAVAPVRDPYSPSVFLPRLERPVRISSPYFDRMQAAQHPPSTAPSMTNNEPAQSSPYQARRLYQRYVG